MNDDIPTYRPWEASLEKPKSREEEGTKPATVDDKTSWEVAGAMRPCLEVRCRRCPTATDVPSLMEQEAANADEAAYSAAPPAEWVETVARTVIFSR